MNRRLRPTAYAVSIILSLAALGCQPGDITGGGDDFGGTGETGDAGRVAGETGGDAESKCVELGGLVSCWVRQGETWAQAFLPCQVEESIGAGILSDAHPIHTVAWGEVWCHDVLLSDSTFCLFGDDGLVLLTNGQDQWEPFLSDAPDNEPAVEPPC